MNRILAALMNEAFCCYEEGIAAARDIDIAMKAGLGHPMGPLELADMVGIDICYHTQKNIVTKYGDLGHRRPTIIDRLYDAGYYGQKTGKGFFDYVSEDDEEEDDMYMFGG